MIAAPNWLAGYGAAWRPPPKLTLSEWADRRYHLAQGDANAGRWRTRPYQRGIMDAITDPAVERVSVIKSARIGWTQIMGAAIAFFMDEDPCPILVVQPTVETAEIYSREMISPMLRAVLPHMMDGPAVRTTGRTLLHKTYPGGVLSLVGANSGAGFAMISRRVVAFDEVDRYPPSAGDEGDPIALGEKRAETYWNRKIIAGSTPKVAGSSRIEQLYEAGDRRRFYVPCSQCGHMDFLVFRPRPDSRGHVMRWPDGRPDLACFECSANGCVISEDDRQAIVAAGEWRADGEFNRHASFQIWTAYSSGPNVGWGDIATEFLQAKREGVDKLRAFVNTTLGETWQERGEAPDLERLYQRREPYAIGSVPAGVVVLTAGVDVQKNRLVYEVRGWAPNRESWSIEAGELLGDTALEATEPGSPWAQLDGLLARTFAGAEGQQWTIATMAVDSGYSAQVVYNWARRYPPTRVLACKGVPGARLLVGATTAVDVNVRGRKLQRGFRMWPIGVDVGKSELYGLLRLELDAEGTAPPGYLHFPEYDREFFKQLTAEHLVKSVNRKTGRATLSWEMLPNRENHFLDTAVLARVAAAVLGIDRLAQPARQPATPPRPEVASAAVSAPPAVYTPPEHTRPAASRPSFWGRPRGGAGGWLGRRR